MKRTFIKVLAGITILCAGCANVNGIDKLDFQISSNEFSKEEQEMLVLTGNRVFRYDIKNLPDKKYELKVIYEVYKDNKKIKEEYMISMIEDSIEESVNNMSLGINILDEKIICAWGEDGTIASTNFEIKEDISKLGYTSFNNDTKINLDEDIYLFYASSGENGFKTTDLGSLVESEKNELISDNKSNIFIKLVCEEK
ncbi:MAG: hypothetical protein ACRDD7_05620 [Peptostreptococcaceae bacterium]